jgi:putative ABC transport system permease protein
VVVVGALALIRVLGGLLFDVQPTDPLTYTSVAVLLATVAVSAAAVPAWRAMRIDSTRVLRF